MDDRIHFVEHKGNWELVYFGCVKLNQFPELSLNTVSIP
jgi:hypothetical protein